MTPQELCEAGRLIEAIQVALDDVKKKPTDVSRRHLLALLLCYNGEWERADRQLEILSTMHPDVAVGVSLCRQLLRAELCRQEFYTAGRVPEFVAEPSRMLELHLKASILVRDEQLREAAELLAQAESIRPQVSGVCDGIAFEDLRELDDLVAPVFEALTSTGKYFWIPISEVISLEMPAPQTLFDLLWRPVRLATNKGPDGMVYFPALYASSVRDESEAIRLGRATDWLGGDGTPVQGTGLRMLMVGEEARSILDITRVEINPEG